MRYEAIDRPPVWGVEVVTEGAIRRWIQEGHFPIGMSLSDVFPLDPVETIYLDTEPLPNFVSRKVDEDERWWTAIDKFGFTVKTLKEQKEAFQQLMDAQDALDAAQQLAERIQNEFHPLELLINITGPVLGINTGPDALALCGYNE